MECPWTVDRWTGLGNETRLCLWIGDRKGIEKQTKTWDKIIVNRERETQTWVRYVRQFLHRGEIVYAYYNNHFAGFGPGSIALFHDVWTRAAASPSDGS